jgi:hypothetical protein
MGHVFPSGEKVIHAESIGTMEVKMESLLFPGINLSRLHLTAIFTVLFLIILSKTMKATPIGGVSSLQMGNWLKNCATATGERARSDCWND